MNAAAAARTPASDVYKLRTGRERVGKLRGFVRAVWAGVVLWSPLHWFRDEGHEPIVRNVVQVVKISDGAVAVEYRYRLLSEGCLHADLLMQRLETLSAPEFAEELGITGGRRAPRGAQ